MPKGKGRRTGWGAAVHGNVARSMGGGSGMRTSFSSASMGLLAPTAVVVENDSDAESDLAGGELDALFQRNGSISCGNSTCRTPRIPRSARAATLWRSAARCSTCAQHSQIKISNLMLEDRLVSRVTYPRGHLHRGQHQGRSESRDSALISLRLDQNIGELVGIDANSNRSSRSERMRESGRHEHLGRGLVGRSPLEEDLEANCHLRYVVN